MSAAESTQDAVEPVVVAVDSLLPGTSGVSLHVKVLETKVVLQRQTKSGAVTIAECLVGDQTGVVLFSARNEQVDAAKSGNYILLKNAKVDMYRGSMRLVVDASVGAVEVEAKQSFEPKTDNNISLTEYEMVPVA